MGEIFTIHVRLWELLKKYIQSSFKSVKNKPPKLGTQWTIEQSMQTGLVCALSPHGPVDQSGGPEAKGKTVQQNQMLPEIKLRRGLWTVL